MASVWGDRIDACVVPSPPVNSRHKRRSCDETMTSKALRRRYGRSPRSKTMNNRRARFRRSVRRVLPRCGRGAVSLVDYGADAGPSPIHFGDAARRHAVRALAAAPPAGRREGAPLRAVAATGLGPRKPRRACSRSGRTFRRSWRARPRPRSGQSHRHRDRGGARFRHRPPRHHARLSVRARSDLQGAGKDHANSSRHPEVRAQRASKDATADGASSRLPFQARATRGHLRVTRDGLHILDLGTGIGRARDRRRARLRRRVLATDIDAERSASRAPTAGSTVPAHWSIVQADGVARHAPVRARAVRSDLRQYLCSGRCSASPPR